MTNNETWYGYTRNEYYALVKQPQDPEWEDLVHDNSEDNFELGRQAVLTNDDSAVMFRLEDI